MCWAQTWEFLSFQDVRLIRCVGHCRRRKIRCIPAPADLTNRCSNCIRLKKECNFFPVDQQPTPEPKRKGSKAQSGTTGGTSETSSPSTTAGQVPDLPTTIPFPHNLNMPSIQDLGGPQMKRQRTESFSPETKGKFFPHQIKLACPDHFQLSQLRATSSIIMDPPTGWRLMYLRLPRLLQTFLRTFGE